MREKIEEVASSSSLIMKKKKRRKDDYRTIVAPIDRVKILLQLQHAQPTIGENERYKGIGDCMGRVVKEQV